MANTLIVPPAIVLCTLNAKYIHASLGLRYLLANMGELRPQTALREYTIGRRPAELSDELLALLGEPQPGRAQVIGFGVYIWNVSQTCALLRLLKAARPTLKVVLGGPEVSHEQEQQAIVALADHVITGWGDVSFPKLCRALLHGPAPLMKIIPGEQPPLDQIELPYTEYSDADLAHRVLYVEASRGCPFKCEFCLSALDKTAWAFELAPFLAELDQLYQRGARQFKFVDRTFNLKIEASARILQFFLDRLPPAPLIHALAPDLFVHFELIPDQLPDRLKTLIAQFPPGVLQFEIGIQSFNPEVQQRISRRQDHAKTLANLNWLVTQSQAHLHTDLIFGLPGETLASFAQGFDTLHALHPQEIQLGLLKRLRGTPIARQTEAWGMVYDAEPPYAVQETSVLSRDEVQRFVRLARYWDLVANSGRFSRTLVLLLRGPSPFAAFLAWSDWLWQRSGQTSGLSPEQLVDYLVDYLTGPGKGPGEQPGQDLQVVRDSVLDALLADYLASGARARPRALLSVLPAQGPPATRSSAGLAPRQQQHGQGANAPMITP
jgi:radical SAM superfamily enzyme YgiQ (UPF0313 family)